jgi:hypothetical protein
MPNHKPELLFGAARPARNLVQVRELSSKTQHLIRGKGCSHSEGCYNLGPERQSAPTRASAPGLKSVGQHEHP